MRNRKNVLSRWYDDKYGENKKKPRKPFRGTPQFTFDQLYITPFTHRRAADDIGNIYSPIPDTNLEPTDILVMDDWLRHLSEERSDVAEFCRQYNVRTSDALLRYTKMSVEEFAQHSDHSSRSNMYFTYERELNLSPTDSRRAIRQKDGVERHIIQ